MRNPTPYLKMRVLGAIDMAEGKTIVARIKAVSQITFTDEDGQPRRFTWRTIQTWYSRYKKHGVTVMENQTRSDKGKSRKVTPEELTEAIDQVRSKIHVKTPSLALLYRVCIEQGVLTRSRIAPNTFRRLVHQYELLKPDDQSASKVRLAFAKAHANEMWQADTLVGPYVQHEGSPVQSRLIAFIDDASRVCCHGQFFPAENVDTLIESLRAGFYKRGVPQSLYVDNGSIYTSKEIIQICARVGCLLHHTPVRDGAAKGKIERFFRSTREQFLARSLDLSSFEALNRQFTHWVEEDYNAHKHSVLEMTPLERFALDRARVRYLPPNQANDELFFVEEDRTVRADNTFSFKTRRFEAPRHLPDRVVQIRFERRRPSERVIVYYKGERMGDARPLDPVANDRKPLPLMQSLALTINEEIRSRITYSVVLPRLSPEAIEQFLLAQMDRAGLGHNTFTAEAMALIIRSGDGLLRRSRNLCLSSLLEAVRDQTRVIDLKQVNRVLLQPHWRKDYDSPIA